MSTALDHKETEFALKIRRALDENIAAIPAASLERMATGRRVAIARKKPERVAFAAPVLTPAFATGDLFHYTGDLDNHIAIRNAYAEVDNVIVKGLTAWAGSRMYRGDDIYLLDFWPLGRVGGVGAGRLVAEKVPLLGVCAATACLEMPGVT